MLVCVRVHLCVHVYVCVCACTHVVGGVGQEHVSISIGCGQPACACVCIFTCGCAWPLLHVCVCACSHVHVCSLGVPMPACHHAGAVCRSVRRGTCMCTPVTGAACVGQTKGLHRVRPAPQPPASTSTGGAGSAHSSGPRCVLQAECTRAPGHDQRAQASARALHAATRRDAEPRATCKPRLSSVCQPLPCSSLTVGPCAGMTGSVHIHRWRHVCAE